ATFDNRTGEPSLEGAAEAAVEYELLNSRFVNVVPRPRVDDALKLMKQPADAILSPATAREVSLRDGGIKAYIAGRLSKVGTTYAIDASLFDLSGGAVAHVAEAALDGQSLLPAVRRLADRLRAKLGESRDAIQATGQTLEKVTTPSLTALTLYSRAYA